MRKARLLAMGLGLLAISMLVIRCVPTPVTPAIVINAPAYNVPVVAAVDPATTPIPLAVDVSFPLAASPCGGQAYPINRDTLLVKLQMLNAAGAVAQEWTIDASSWWSQTEDRIQGTITIGGAGSNQSWALYQLEVSISNSQGPATVYQAIRVERPIADFPGGTFVVHVTGLGQSPSNCLLPQVAFDVVMNLISGQTFNVTLPAGSGYPADITLPLPEPIGTLVVHATLDTANNNIAFDPVTLSGIDLGPYNVPGFNCLVGGTADGAIDGQVFLGVLDGTIRVSNMNVAVGSGTGACNLSQPSSSCNLSVGLNGTALSQ